MPSYHIILVNTPTHILFQAWEQERTELGNAHRAALSQLEISYLKADDMSAR